MRAGVSSLDTPCAADCAPGWVRLSRGVSIPWWGIGCTGSCARDAPADQREKRRGLGPVAPVRHMHPRDRCRPNRAHGALGRRHPMARRSPRAPGAQARGARAQSSGKSHPRATVVRRRFSSVGKRSEPVSFDSLDHAPFVVGRPVLAGPEPTPLQFRDQVGRHRRERLRSSSQEAKDIGLTNRVIWRQRGDVVQEGVGISRVPPAGSASRPHAWSRFRRRRGLRMPLRVREPSRQATEGPVHQRVADNHLAPVQGRCPGDPGCTAALEGVRPTVGQYRPKQLLARLPAPVGNAGGEALVQLGPEPSGSSDRLGRSHGRRLGPPGDRPMLTMIDRVARNRRRRGRQGGHRGRGLSRSRRRSSEPRAETHRQLTDGLAQAR